MNTEIENQPLCTIGSEEDLANSLNKKDKAYYEANKDGYLEFHRDETSEEMASIFLCLVRINLEKKDDTKIVKFFANLNKYQDTVFYPAGIIAKKVNTRIVFMSDLDYLSGINITKQVRKRLESIIRNLNERVKALQSYQKTLIREAKAEDLENTKKIIENILPENAVVTDINETEESINVDITIRPKANPEEINIELTCGETGEIHIPDSGSAPDLETN